MKKYLTYITENKKEYLLEKRWKQLFNNLRFYVKTDKPFIAFINSCESLIKKGIDVNIICEDGSAALALASAYGSLVLVNMLLKQPGIDINRRNDLYPSKYYALAFAARNDHKDIVKVFLARPEINIKFKLSNGESFLDETKDKSYLIDYSLQKKILNNGREDILFFLDQYGLIHPNIKSEVPELFTAKKWGLVS